jgi:hypothetical protein
MSDNVPVFTVSQLHHGWTFSARGAELVPSGGAAVLVGAVGTLRAAGGGQRHLVDQRA